MYLFAAKSLVYFIPSDLRHSSLEVFGNHVAPQCEKLIDLMERLGVSFPMLEFMGQPRAFATLCYTLSEIIEGVSNTENLALKKTIQEKPEKFKFLLLEMVIQVAKYDLSFQVAEAIQQTSMPCYAMGMPAMAYLILSRGEAPWTRYSRIHPAIISSMRERVSSNPVLFVALARFLNLTLDLTIRLAVKTGYALDILETLGIQATRKIKAVIRTELARVESSEDLVRLYISGINM